MKINYFLFIVVITIVSTAKTTRKFKNSELLIDNNQLTLNSNESSINFFVLADWGGLPILHRTLVQQTTANQMGRMGSQYNTKFQLGLGDNFYYYGVDSVKDHRFKDTFEDVYDSEHLKNTPWFHQLGNHDHYGNAQAQIDYMSKSNRWIFPDFNYTVDIMTNQKQKKLITILMIDTILLCGNNYFSLNPFKPVKDGNTPIFMNEQERKLADVYFIDLENKLKKISETNVPYIIVGGHFPVYSAAEHGPTQCLVDRLMPLLHKYKVSAYLCGHDHNLQHISNTFLNHTVEYMIAGPNSVNHASSEHLTNIPVNSLKFTWPTKSELLFGGFLMVETNEQKMKVNFMKADGTTLYQKIILPRV